MKMPLILTDDDVERLIDMSALVASMEQALLDKHHGFLVAPPRHSVDFAEDGSLVFTIGGVIGTRHLAGFRAYDTFSKLSTEHAQLVAVWDSSTGRFKGVVVGDKIGALRTGAIGGVAIKYMSQVEAQTVGIIGSGQQARTQLLAAACVRNIQHVKVYSRSVQNSAAFADEMKRKLSINIVAVETAQQAVTDAQIVICATSSNTPVIEAQWLAPTAHVNTVGPKLIDAHETGIDIAARARVIATDSPAQLKAYSKPFFLHGTSHMERISDLSELVVGNVSRSKIDGVSLFCSVGLAGTEVIAANELLEAAQSQ